MNFKSIVWYIKAINIYIYVYFFFLFCFALFVLFCFVLVWFCLFVFVLFLFLLWDNKFFFPICCGVWIRLDQRLKSGSQPVFS